MQSMTIGDVEVFRINELDVETLTMEDLLPEHDPAAFDRDRELLVPEHWDPRTTLGEPQSPSTCSGALARRC